MSRMKHILRKLHIGGGGGGGGETGDLRHRPLPDPRPKPPPASAPSASSSPSASTAPPSSTSSSTPGSRGTDAVESTGGGGGAESRCEPPPGGDFSFFEEEYQVHLALALSASDPDGLEDPDSVQMKAATQMSLGCSGLVVTDVGGGGGGSSTCTGDMEYLSLRYWNYNVVDYNEKLMDGFYDVYGITSNHNLQDQMPSLVDLQAISVSDNIDYEVVIVNRAVDEALQQLERRAMSIALESRTEVGPIASGLVKKIADLVVDNMGGPVGDADDMLRRWAIRSYELRTSLNTIVLPLGSLNVGLSRQRALLFKVLADRINLPCRLVKGSYYTGTDEGAVNFIKVDYDSEYILDLMGAPGILIPAESPINYLQASGPNLLSSSTIEQTVKDICLALDKVSCQSEKISEVPEESSSNTNLMSGTVNLKSEEKSRVAPPVGADVNLTVENQTQRFEHKFGELLPLLDRQLAAITRNKAAASPAQQMKVNDVSKYVVDAAKDPDFAQKLHAVLLESGVSPPPDLFSDLNPQNPVEQRDLKKSISTERREVEKEVRLQNNIPLNFQRSSVPSTEGESSCWTGDSNKEKTISVKMDGKRGINLNTSGSPVDMGTPSPIATSEGLVPHVTLISATSLANSRPKGEGMVLHTVMESRVSNEKEILDIDSSQNQIVSVPKSFGGHYNDLPILNNANDERIKPIMDGAFEWEIPWEDLQVGERIGLGSYGEVYRADWNGTEVAVKKFLDQDLSGDALEQFRFEVKIMLRLRHPNVVLFMGAVTRPPNLSILTEFLPRFDQLIVFY